MTDNMVCSFHQFGHCKFGTHCRKKHILETCNNLPCMEENCTKTQSSVDTSCSQANVNSKKAAHFFINLISTWKKVLN